MKRGYYRKPTVRISRQAPSEKSASSPALCTKRSRGLTAPLGDPPFNYLIHSMPMNEAARHHYHWQLKILPQLSRAAGFEWGTGAHINAVAPEQAARLLRDALL